MTRIIAGLARGTTLDVPARGTRPTSDRVRESLFGALTSYGALDGAHVLDLYAGSGALGLEALSRGAASAALVENSRGAAAAATRNAQRVAKAGAPLAVVHGGTVQSFLRHTSGRFDLIFADPPYDAPESEVAEVLRLTRSCADDDAIMVIERPRRAAEVPWPETGWSGLREGRYGDTVLWWGQPTLASQSR